MNLIESFIDPGGHAVWNDPLVLALAAGSVAVLLLHAALAKLRDRELFEQHLAAYGVPDRAGPALAWGIPLAEGLAALGLASPWRAGAALLAAALLLAYASAMAWQRAHGRRPDCGCGGAPLPLSWALVLRNAALAGLALLAALPSNGREFTLADAAVATAGVLLATLLYTALNQALRHAAALATDRQTSSGRFA